MESIKIYNSHLQSFDELRTFTLDNETNDKFWVDFIDQCVDGVLIKWLEELSDHRGVSLANALKKIDLFNESDSNIKSCVLSELGITSSNFSVTDFVQYDGVFDMQGKRIIEEYIPKKGGDTISTKWKVTKEAVENITLTILIKNIGNGEVKKIPLESVSIRSIRKDSFFYIPITIDEHFYGENIELSLDAGSTTVDSFYIGEIDEKLDFDVDGYMLTMRKIAAGSYEIWEKGHYDIYDWDKNVVKETINIGEFWMSTTVVTNQLARLLFPEKIIPGPPDFPFILSPNEAKQFVAKLNLKLSDKLPIGYVFDIPQYYQWEIAALGGHRSKHFRYPGSNEANEVGWFKENSGGKMHPVEGLNPNEIGLYDLCGNADEICYGYFDGWNEGFELHGGNNGLPNEYWSPYIDYHQNRMHMNTALRLCLTKENAKKK